MDWKTCATDISPIVQLCRLASIWKNLLSPSDDCAHAPGKPKRFSLAGMFMRPWRRDQHTGTEDPLLAQMRSADWLWREGSEHLRKSLTKYDIAHRMVFAVSLGRTNFSELQAALSKGRHQSIAYFAFDLLFLEGFDLRGSPQVERKRVLKMLFDETGLASHVL